MSQTNFNHFNSSWRVKDQFMVYESYHSYAGWCYEQAQNRATPIKLGGSRELKSMGLFPYPPHTKLDILAIMPEGQALTRPESPFANIQSLDNAPQPPKVHFYLCGLQVTLTLDHRSFSYSNLRSYFTTYIISSLKYDKE